MLVDILRAAGSGTIVAGELRYLLSRHTSKQPITHDRILLTPQIDLSQYLAKAVVDWVEFLVSIRAANQSVNLQRTARDAVRSVGGGSTIYVAGPKKETAHHGHEFRVRIQNPGPASIDAVLYGFLNQYPTARFPSHTPIMAIEISIDFFLRNRRLSADQHRKQRELLIEVLRRHLSMEPIARQLARDEPRVFERLWGAMRMLDLPASPAPPEKMQAIRTAAASDATRIRRFPVNTTSYVGKKDGVVALRLMDKTTDNRNPEKGTADDLPLESCRPRLEVTLKMENLDEVGGAAAVGLHEASDLLGFNYASLRALLFDFWLPTLEPAEAIDVDPDPKEWEIFERGGVYALDLCQRGKDEKTAAPRVRKPTKRNRCTAYSQLNAKVRKALVQLTKDWRR